LLYSTLCQPSTFLNTSRISLAPLHHPQEECLREESRYHYLQHLSTITKIKLDRADYEKQCQKGKAQLMRNFSSLKEFYAVRAALYTAVMMGAPISFCVSVRSLLYAYSGICSH
jgi:hypothetical protein